MRGGRRSAWREPMTWFIAGLPLVVIVASIVTIAVARRSPADASAGDTRRIAQIQIDDLAPDHEAARRGLQAQLQGDAAHGRIEIVFAAATATGAERLDLSMLHPVDQRQDRHFSLQRDGDAWHATTEPWSAHDWELRLQPPSGEWRLNGRLASGAARATLAPAVAR
jgi:hypothetical protein